MVVTNPNHNSLAPEELFLHKVYWSKQLSGDLPKTNCISDRIRSKNTTKIDRQIAFELSADLAPKIIQIAQRSDFSIYLLLLSSFIVFLHKYLDRDEVIVGLPSYKTLAENVIPLRFKLDEKLTFKDIIERVKNIALESYSYQQYPFDDLVKQLKISDIANRCPLFDLVIALENIHRLNYLETINNDLTVTFDVENKKINGKILYKSSLFEQNTVELFSKYYLNALAASINQIDNLQISDLSLITASDRAQILQGFNNNSREYPVNETIDRLFEAQVTKTPDRLAVSYKNNHLTYQELNQRANQLAKLLLQLNIKPGEFIAVVKARDIDFLISILAILKVGGVYIPIDSTYPPARIEYMVTDARVKTILTDAGSLATLNELIRNCPEVENLIRLNDRQVETQSLPQAKKKHEVEIIDFRFSSAAENLNNLNVARGTDLAYTIYTSGSTGAPKGTMIRHGGAINHIYAQFEALNLTADFTFLQSAPASSDISVWQFLAPILIGGQTIIVDTETIYDPSQLFHTIQRSQITLVELVPVVLKGLLEYIDNLAPDKRKLPYLQWMMVTGESVSVDLVNDWLKLYPAIPIVNAYGPSEASDDITQAIVKQPLPSDRRTVSIGKPLANLNLYILDKDLKILPIGVPGEICVSGYGVGLGYWRNQQKTQASFIPNPFSQTAKPLPGVETDLLYKTGDLGRWLPDGSIEYLGRIDNQVKIRGFRIELGEIESCLSQHSNIRENVVVLDRQETNEAQLIAYVVAKQEPVPSVGELRNFLKEKLPEQMIPSAFVMLESMPIAPSGKIDRQALPKPDNLRPELDTAYVSPRNEIERQVADIWQKILKVEKVGIQDNFFELGGHSLNVLQVYSRLRSLFPELVMTDIFKYPTVSSISRYLNQEEDSFAKQSEELNKELELGKSRLKQRLLRNKQQKI